METGRHPALGTKDIVTEKSDHQMSVEVTNRVIKETSRQLEQTNELIDKANDARSALDVLANSWNTEWVEFLKNADTRIRELRERRMGIDSESRVLMSHLREVRAFFLDANYATEIERLRDFIGLCERLKALKDSGFLDTVADTMLRLSSK